MSARVLRVEAHVGLREVAEEDLRLAALPRQRQGVLHLVGPDGGLELAPLAVCEVYRVARRHHLATLDLEVGDERRAGRPGLAGGLQNAPEVGVSAVEGGLDE